jgi:hypothetical protein
MVNTQLLLLLFLTFPLLKIEAKLQNKSVTDSPLLKELDTRIQEATSKIDFEIKLLVLGVKDAEI